MFLRFRCLNSLLLAVCCFFFLLGLNGCKRRVQVSVPSDPTAGLPAEERVGVASWYGEPFHGRRTSNGETYNQYSMTAAHRTLPFDSLVGVKNLENGKEVKVRINDRGPFVKNRVIDLSYAAAREINMVGPGTARVSLKVLQMASNPFPLTIQVGSFRDKRNAEKLKDELQEDYRPIVIQKFKSPEGQFHRVLVGEYGNMQAASAVLRKLKSRRYEGLIVRLDP